MANWDKLNSDFEKVLNGLTDEEFDKWKQDREKRIKNKNMSRKVRVRFAPSPTGALHMGGVRTALYNYLFAKKHGGDFILRIEDTDKDRFVPGAEEYIVEALKWCGIEPNEGVGFMGTHKETDQGGVDHDIPNDLMYRQSYRNSMAVYDPFIKKLLEEGNAYYAFDTKESLDYLRNDIAEKRKAGLKVREFSYGVFTRDNLVNSLRLSEEDVKAKIDSGVPYVVRLKMPKDVEIKFVDLIRGNVSVKSHTIDDKVIFKSDGLPTYHLANVVDDHLMDISHVIRGEEWLPSAPLHIMLYKMLGWEDTMPEFIHLPLIMGPNGKLSKRDGDALGFPVFPLKWTDPKTKETSSGYRENGFMPEAFNNMIAFLGWNPGGTEEILSMDEMIDKFSFSKVGKSGAKFDLKKANWFNHQHMKKATNEALAKMWIESGNLVNGAMNECKISSPNIDSFEYLAKVCGLLKEKVSNIHEFWNSGKYFFVTPDPSVGIENTPFLAEVITNVSKDEVFNHDSLRAAFDVSVKESGIDAREAGMILRLAVTGMKVGPPLFDVMELIGKTESLNRIASNVVVNHE